MHSLPKALALAICTLTAAQRARADLRPSYELLSRSPVPANGILIFTYDPEVTVRITSVDGAEVAGAFIEAGSGIWRPEREFAVGSYLADVTYAPNPELGKDASFEVVPALAPTLEFLEVQVTSLVQAGAILEEACCLEGAANVSGVPCVDDCKPLCLPLSYAAEQYVQVYYAKDSDDVEAWQSHVSSPANLPSGHFSEGFWRVEGSPDELCGVADVFTWLDDSTTQVTECIPNPKPDLAPIRESVSSFGYITECTVPPPDYVAEWCSAQAYTCEVELPTLDDTSIDSVLAACSHYYELCDRPSPIAASQTDSGIDTMDTTTSVEESTPSVKREAGESGCACTVGTHSSNASGWLGALSALIALVARTVRRRARTRALSADFAHPSGFDGS